jgi:rubrerythrin
MLTSLDTWLDYFEQNALESDDIPWNLSDTLTDDERQIIAKSIAAFQLGEYSEGRGLMKFAKEYAQKNSNERLISITRLFIKEEQNHALLLKKFMEKHEIPLLKKHWTDSAFRKLRKAAGYEWSISVLITAEMIALTYYRVLHDCTDSILLKAICQKILRDENAHVRYESSLINHMHAQKPDLLKRLACLKQGFLYFSTVLVVYTDHYRVVRGGGYSFIKFWRSCWSDFFTHFGLSLPNKVL